MRGCAVCRRDRVAAYGERLRLWRGIASFRYGASPERVIDADPWTPVHGTVLGGLQVGVVDDWPHGPIDARTVRPPSSALWSFKGAEVDRERFMRLADQESASDRLFKVKTPNKGKRSTRGAARLPSICEAHRRQGVYWMRSSIGTGLA